MNKEVPASFFNSPGHVRLREMFDEALEWPRHYRDLFFSGFYGRVESLVLIGSVADDRFVSGVEVLFDLLKHSMKKEKESK